jgi:hypothetical protein
MVIYNQIKIIHDKVIEINSTFLNSIQNWLFKIIDN